MSGICFQRIWGWGGGLVGLQKTQVWPWVDDCWIAETGVWGPIGFLCICSLWQIFNSFLFCVLVIFKKTFIYWINLFGCIRSELWHLGSSVSIVAHGIFSCSPWGLVPWPGIEPGPPTLGPRSLSHWTTREIPVCNFLLTRRENPSVLLRLGWLQYSLAVPGGTWAPLSVSSPGRHCQRDKRPFPAPFTPPKASGQNSCYSFFTSSFFSISELHFMLLLIIPSKEETQNSQMLWPKSFCWKPIQK